MLGRVTKLAKEKKCPRCGLPTIEDENCSYCKVVDEIKMRDNPHYSFDEMFGDDE